MNELKCVKYDEIKNNGGVHSMTWPKECWPNTIFTDADYPCRTCELQKERYKTILQQSIQAACSRKDSNIHQIKREVFELSGTIVDICGDIGLLVGASATLEDYYYIWIDSDLKCHFSSCVGRIEKVDEIPARFSILQYMMKNQQKDLLEIVMKYMNAHNDTDILITPINTRKIGL